MCRGNWLLLCNSIHSASSFTISRYLGYYQNVGVYTHCAGKSLYQWVPRKKKPISQKVLIKYMVLGVGHCLTGLKDPKKVRKSILCIRISSWTCMLLALSSTPGRSCCSWSRITGGAKPIPFFLNLLTAFLMFWWPCKNIPGQWTHTLLNDTWVTGSMFSYIYVFIFVNHLGLAKSFLILSHSIHIKIL